MRSVRNPFYSTPTQTNHTLCSQMQGTMPFLAFSLKQSLNPDELRSIAYTSGSFSDMQKDSLQQKKFLWFTSPVQFNLYLRGVQRILHCNHKTLEPSLLCSMRISKLNHWSLELSDYNLMFFHIKGSNSILADEISRLKTLVIYKDPLVYPKHQTQWPVLQRWLPPT